MPEILQAMVLALLQGVTEFLPISSSAHLILPSQVLGWPDQGLAFDVAVHLGSLIAVVAYFRKDILALLSGWFGQFAGHGINRDAKLAWWVIVATVPAGLVGLLAKDFIEENLRSTLVIAATTIIFGVLLLFADRKTSERKTLLEMGLYAALFIGCAQALALIPGTSRSGITITAALLMGYSRSDSARFSFLMSIPIITLSALLLSIDLIAEGVTNWLVMLVGVIVSGVSAYLCIYFFLAFINKIGMLPFVIYRLILGFVLLGLAFL